ncbi:MAG TPA: prolipoprotein diacylglyceryl transferase [Vicinamibacterales bacterium]|nr:prolipoprotein diacylglyceryl transferase [Vicinamibacterales bacterium]HOG29325.1 prolipoprotein diacylglyceryl transferase [Vicinamibacterales bacterium]HOQ60857.1 prolipoprotein diacylglyceryl transferase [Vicinamibacterales bacterium]HPW19715.1 prolipoprotein diacylglyceryl transferase [Vicinamibacterales bacterium]
MLPRLLELGPFTVYSYGVLLASAYLLALYVAFRRARRFGLDATRVLDLGVYIIIAALIGAKLLLLIVDFDHFRRHPGEIWTLVRTGGVFYGGLIVAFGVGLWYVRRHHLPLWPVADAVAPGLALGHVVGRFGCLLAGCCYGKPTTVPWAVTFTDPFAASNVGTPLHVPLHPTQLYDAGAEFLILLFLLATERRWRRRAGWTWWTYILLYGISRYVIEMFRGDPRGAAMGLSTSQWIALGLVPLSIAMLAVLWRRGPAAAPAGPAPAAPRRKRRGR